MKILFIIIQGIMLYIFPRIVTEDVGTAQNQYFFTEIEKHALQWNKIIYEESIMYESDEFDAGKLQVITDKAGRIKSIRWAVSFNIRTASFFNRKNAGKISSTILLKDNMNWLKLKLFEIDKFPVTDHYFSQELSNQKVTINYTKQNQHLEVMIKLN